MYVSTRRWGPLFRLKSNPLRFMPPVFLAEGLSYAYPPSSFLVVFWNLLRHILCVYWFCYDCFWHCLLPPHSPRQPKQPKQRQIGHIWRVPAVFSLVGCFNDCGEFLFCRCSRCCCCISIRSSQFARGAYPQRIPGGNNNYCPAKILIHSVRSTIDCARLWGN